MSRERRAHARIAVPINVRLVVGSDEIELNVRDVSKRGIFLYTKEPPAKVGAELVLKLALTAGIKPLTVRAEIIRFVYEPAERGGGILGIALKFLQLDVDQEGMLVELLDRAMLGRGTQMRTFPRIYHLIEVICRTRTEARVLMRDIGEGGVGLTVDQPLVMNEEVSLDISRTGSNPLRLQGWAVSCEPIPEQRGLYRIGLRFGRMSPEIRKDLQDYLKKLYRGREP